MTGPGKGRAGVEQPGRPEPKARPTTSPARPLPPAIRPIAVLALALGVLLASGCVYLPQPPLPDLATLAPEERGDRNERVYRAAWNLVNRGYFSRDYNEIDWEAAYARYLPTARAATTDAELYAVINTMIAELGDEHTHALTPQEVEEMDRERRVLLGLIVRPMNPNEPQGPLLIFDTIPGSNAAAQGIQPGWVLLSCDGQAPGDVLGVGRLRENQVVACVFRDHEGREHAIGITAREVSTRPLLVSRELAHGIRYLRIDRFDRVSARWLRARLKEHAEAPAVILDLRQNPGGDAAALGRMLGEFFTERVDMGTFITRRGFNRQLHTWRWFASATYTGPVAILVSRVSASSAEIFSAVMQYHDRATVFGETTSGAVLASRFFPLPGGGRLQLSIDDYIAPDGQRLEGRGVTPDFEVAQGPDDLRAGRDPVLAAAVEHLSTILADPDAP